MRVNVTKSLHVNEIPKEVRSMVDKIHKYMSYDLQDNLQNIVRLSLSSSGEEFFASIDSIDAFRKDLATIDIALQECQNIIKGYKDVVMAPQDEETSSTEADEFHRETNKQEEVNYEYDNQYEDG